MASKKYAATYGINGGVNKGWGTLPDHFEESREIRARTPAAAFSAAMAVASELAWNYFPNPDTGRTEVTLLSLLGPGGIPVPFDAHSAIASRPSLGSIVFDLASPPPAATG